MGGHNLKKKVAEYLIFGGMYSLSDLFDKITQH